MRLHLSYALACTLTLLACTDSGDILAPSPEDAALITQLTGLWTNGTQAGYRIRFNPNLTYLDSAYTLSVTPGVQYLLYVSTGRFRVNHGILSRFDKSYHVFPDPAGQGRYGLSAFDDWADVSVRGNRLTWQPISVFMPSGGSTDDLYGGWTMSRHAYTFANDSLVYSGQEQVRYTFTRTPPRYLRERTFSPAAPWPITVDTIDYAYNPPLLSTYGLNYPDVRVAFNSQEMQWYYIFDAYQLTRY
jgi:hypothetical protein